MYTIRKSAERGHAQHGWLESRHTFSFAGYYDPDFMSFRALRVINEDRVAPGMGFDPHSHRDMEILSYVIEGGLEHGDNLGNGSVIRPGELQLMRAGTGVTHSEYNHSSELPVHFLQIWITPDEEGLAPGYDQRAFALQERRGSFRLLASPNGEDESIRIHQDVRIHGTVLETGETARHALDSDRYAWVQVVKGDVELPDGVQLAAGDGVAFEKEPSIELTARTSAEVLLFDLA